MIISVGTGANGKDIAHGICFSISSQNPDFLLFITTKKSIETTMPYIESDNILQGKEYHLETIKDENDIELIEEECSKYIFQLKEKGFSNKDITVDFTSGTKAMSAGLILASFYHKIKKISYITGERNGYGRVISGRERMISLEPNLIFFKDLLSEAIDLFNRYQYEGGIQLVEEAKGLLVSEEKYFLVADFIGSLCRIYMNWDRFFHREAFEILNKIEKDNNNNNLLLKFQLKRIINNHKQFLYKEQAANYCFEKAVDLYHNARRRKEEGKFDDAVARCYRLLEYLAQYQLYQKYQLDTENINVEKLPKTFIVENRIWIKNKGKVDLSLYHSYQLLNALGDSLGKYFIDQFNNEGKNLKKALEIRNHSILAHGFQAIDDKKCDFILSLTEKFLIETDKHLFEQLQGSMAFPKLSNFQSYII